MGYGFCGKDDHGREFGYLVISTCDHPDCDAEIDRGMGFACGEDHFKDHSCRGYYCADHGNNHEDWEYGGICYYGIEEDVPDE